MLLFLYDAERVRGEGRGWRWKLKWNLISALIPGRRRNRGRCRRGERPRCRRTYFTKVSYVYRSKSKVTFFVNKARWQAHRAIQATEKLHEVRRTTSTSFEEENINKHNNSSILKSEISNFKPKINREGGIFFLKETRHWKRRDGTQSQRNPSTSTSPSSFKTCDWPKTCDAHVIVGKVNFYVYDFPRENSPYILQTQENTDLTRTLEAY